MDIRCHYPLDQQLTHKFVPWISLTDPRFNPGLSGQHVATDRFDFLGPTEIAVPPEELRLHNSELCLWLDQLDIQVYNIRMFRSRPNTSYKLHVDFDPTKGQMDTLQDEDQHVYDQIVKLNIIYHSWGSTMTWYALKEGATAYTRGNVSGHHALSFKQEDCNQIYHTDCDTACLIHGGRIHTLTNSNNKGKFRLCYSLFLQNKSFTLTWEKAVDIFKPWLGE